MIDLRTNILSGVLVGTVEVLVRLTEIAFEGLVWAWPVIVALFIALVVFAAGAHRRARFFTRPKVVLQLSPFLFSFVILVLGSWFACENCSPSSLGQGHRYVWAMRAADGLPILQVILAVWLVWVAEGAELFSAVFQLLLLWWSFVAYFVAGMSMSGDWL